jgi:membrane-associated phospholipid phosphatase
MGPAFRAWIALGAWTFAAVVICVLYVDRPVAEFAHATFHRGRLQARANDFLTVLLALSVLVFFGSFLAAAWRMMGRPLPPWSRIPVMCAWSVAWALSSTIVFKRLIGRSSPDFVYIVRHIYKFNWLNGYPGFESFPSGTMSVTTACLSVIWIELPRWRPVCAVTLLGIAGALVITNSHWIGDLLGGAFLGGSIGWMMVAMKGRAA